MVIKVIIITFMLILTFMLFAVAILMGIINIKMLIRDIKELKKEEKKL